jgi:hypothetical protein
MCLDFIIRDVRSSIGQTIQSQIHGAMQVIGSGGDNRKPRIAT